MKTKKPLVSVMMPVYNAEAFLVESINSILTQTVSDFEFLIIDDYSSDKSWNIIKRFARRDSRIKIYRNKKRKGLVKSLNFLIPLTTGKYVARMDADDISLVDRFEKQMKFLEQNKKIVACGGQEYIIDESGKIIADKNFPTNPKDCYNKLMNYMVIQPPLLFARGSVFRMFKYDNHVFKNDDITMHFKLLTVGEFGNVPEFIFKYRKVNKSLTHRNPKLVYFLALKARLYAMLNHNYRPAVVNVILAVLETIVVSCLPNNAIIFLFESIRFTSRIVPTERSVQFRYTD